MQLLHGKTRYVASSVNFTALIYNVHQTLYLLEVNVYTVLNVTTTILSSLATWKSMVHNSLLCVSELQQQPLIALPDWIHFLIYCTLCQTRVGGRLSLCQEWLLFVAYKEGHAKISLRGDVFLSQHIMTAASPVGFQCILETANHSL